MQHSVHKHISDAEYFADREYVNASKLKVLLDKPSLYLELQESDTEAKLFGRAFHCLLLEPKEFWNRYWVMPDMYKGPTFKNGKQVSNYAEEKWDFRKTHHKDAKEDLEANNAKLSMLMPEEYSAMLEMQKSVYQFGMQERFLEGGEGELSLFNDSFTWEENVIESKVAVSLIRSSKVKVKMDYTIIKLTDRILITDLKSTRDASPHWFAKEVYNMNYDLQAALQIDMASQHFGLPVEYLWLACEKQAPFCCAWYKPDQHMITSGRRKYAIGLHRWEEYKSDGFATTYSAAKYPETLISPSWKVDKDL